MAGRMGWCPAVQAFGPEDVPGAVAVEIGKEVGDDEGQVIEGEVGAAAERTDHGALLVTGFPG